MEENLFNLNLNDDFNPEDHGIEMDEIAKIYALADMEEHNRMIAKEYANRFYNDFEDLSISAAILNLLTLIKSKEINIEHLNTTLDYMILVFQETEEYEKCHKCLLIKNGVNDRI